METPTLKRALNPLANHRLKLKKLHPKREMVLLRIDPVKKQTDGGLILPDKSVSQAGQFTDAGAGRDAPKFHYQGTAVVIAVGPDVEGVEVGERFLMTSPAVPVTVADADEDEPLGLIDYRDLLVEVK